jgi:hypothetical protein
MDSRETRGHKVRANASAEHRRAQHREITSRVTEAKSSRRERTRDRVNAEAARKFFDRD